MATCIYCILHGLKLCIDYVPLPSIRTNGYNHGEYHIVIMTAALSYILSKQHLFYCDSRVLDTVFIKISMSNSFPFIGPNLQDIQTKL